MKTAALFALLAVASACAAPRADRGSQGSPEPAAASTTAAVAEPLLPVSPAGLVTPAKPPPPRVVETEAPLHADYRIIVDSVGDTTRLRVEHAGDLLALRRGDVRSSGVGRASLDLEGEAAEQPIVLEATAPKTMETTRAVLRVSASAPFKVVSRVAERPRPVASDERENHACRAHDDGAGGFAVVCRVDSEANAASVTANDPGEGVAKFVGPRTLVRFDFDGLDDSAEAKMITYSARGRGVIIRAEASHLTGERAPSLALLAEGRAQPAPIRPRVCCRIPRHLDNVD